MIGDSALDRRASRVRRLSVLSAAVVGYWTGAVACAASPPEEFADVLNIRDPGAAGSGPLAHAFFDQGAWQGYALRGLPERGFGFKGPYFPADARRGAEVFAALQITDRSSGQRLDSASLAIHSSALPGRLVQSAAVDGVEIRETLIFVDSKSVLLRIQLRSATQRHLALAVLGGEASEDASYSVRNAEMVETFRTSPIVVRTALLGVRSVASTSTDAKSYRLELNEDLELAAGEEVSLFVIQTCQLDAVEAWQQPLALAARGAPILAAEFADNESRWNGYLASVFASHSRLLREPRYRRVAVKAVETLIDNWRAPRGDLHHDGLIPSYSNPEYDGFWAWDSWKHAIALSHFAPALAREQIRAMFDYQAASGMIPDVIYRGKAENNWRDTKPPLAALAVWEVYRQTHDVAFVREMFPHLLRYHRWWYASRDHDGDGLAEYGSTDGTLIAAAWESGMDNAARFDHTKLLQNGPDAWSMDQESVDLNCYLLVEKRLLARMAVLVAEPAAAAGLRSEAERLARLIRERFFDRQAGYFRDLRLQHDGYVGEPGPESWMPLWAGVATAAQAASVAALMANPTKFSTYLPLPTVAADSPAFAPRTGYWRGPVWIDQAYFGVRALQNYGRKSEASALREHLLEHAFGLTGQAAMYENYDPRTGQGLNAPNFSWSAAYFLLLVSEE